MFILTNFDYIYVVQLGADPDVVFGKETIKVTKDFRKY